MNICPAFAQTLHGVVLSNITRKQFTDAGLDEAIEPHYVICSDEMTDNFGSEAIYQSGRQTVCTSI